MKRLKLNIKERVMLPEVLPQSGNKLQQIIVRGLILKTEFKPAEIDKYGLTFSHQGVAWNEKAKSAQFEYELSEAEISILKESAGTLDKEARVTQHNLSLIEKIESL
ncbi:MAG: hypothetical protein VB072_05590 [Lentimicrobium sp.]|nr:hypothetical protein [Lentimicrobium sp.]MEA5109883.1 hypothetical protein [Lentimicrobium sp.]